MGDREAALGHLEQAFENPRFREWAAYRHKKIPGSKKEEGPFLEVALLALAAAAQTSPLFLLFAGLDGFESTQSRRVYRRRAR